MKLVLRPVTPIGSYRIRTMAGDVAVMDDYPVSPNGKALRARRLELDLTIREAAKLLGLRMVEVSQLEMGSTVTDWQLAMNKLNGGK